MSAAAVPDGLELVDAHHHYLDLPRNDRTFQRFLGSLLADNPRRTYLPDDYRRDVVEPLVRSFNVRFAGSVHVECMPDDGVQEAEWVYSVAAAAAAKDDHDTNRCRAGGVRAIVASCDLTSPTVEQELRALHGSKAGAAIRGVRWILDYAHGPFTFEHRRDGKGQPQRQQATHVATTRHKPSGTDGADYLRLGGSFERGFAALERFQYSFDLQCAPEQMAAAAALIAKYPNVPVVVDHLGKPRTLPAYRTTSSINGNNDHDDIDNVIPVWRDGMRALSQLPNVYVKISMLGWIVPGWIATFRSRKKREQRKRDHTDNNHDEKDNADEEDLNDGDQRQQRNYELLKQLVQETVDLFAPSRCMVAFNWWNDAATSDADGYSDTGPSPVEFVDALWNDFLDKYSDDDKRRIFAGTAKQFYRIE